MLRPRGEQYLLEGAFTLDGDHYHISLDSNLRSVRLSRKDLLPKTNSPYMVVWKDSDTVEHEHDGMVSQRSFSNGSLCTAETPDLRLQPGHPSPFQSSKDRNAPGHGRFERFRRQDGLVPDGDMDGFNPTDSIGSNAGCPSSRLVALIGITTDCTYTAEFDSVDDARENIISQINIASQVYEDTFNIALAIRNLTISGSSCPSDASPATPWNRACTANIDISERLTLFSEWRNQFRDGNAAWTLLSACESGSSVGMAWIANLCSDGGSRSFRGGRSSVAATNVVVRTGSEWQVFAHELAHNFGATHDCTSDTCGSGSSPSDNCCPLSASACDAEGQYIMNPRSSRQIEGFSPCTLGTICSAIGDRRIDTSCLVSEDEVPDINDSQCGNGIVEPGEACDCGGELGCSADSCCDPDTCQLRDGAACDPDSDACCTDQCQVAQSGLVCRESTGSCDPEETCDGSSSICPQDAQECDDNGNGRGSGDGRGGSDSSWFDRNRTAVIASSASVGGVIVILIAVCAVTACVRRSKRKGGKRLKKNSPFVDEPGVPPQAPPTATGETPVPSVPPTAHRYA
ncbi:hypothetical protein FZEAL_2006 [Fusarium zealandicum]|uniref:Disintegrin and metalloproteinase domain-containing protein B n=1 Tax=Fusarium zealandicum TaxID=1053134 RepID=A0A8H4URW7_9HYPO|nr:hypothetical protein FZEAL_2006 [Fusarium zealandicum]